MDIKEKATKVINTKVNGDDLVSYYVGFDLNDAGEMEYRIKEFVNIIINIIPEFAFGYHQGTKTDNTEIITKVSEAARAIYKIKEFREVSDLYLADKFLDDDIDIEDKYLKRGEFGELILHFLLKNFHGTVPLISKVYFKDSYGHAVHGFDSVHVHDESKTLWLGESKLYSDGKKGLSALIKDIKEHFNRDYLNDEFSIISKRVKDSDHLEDSAKTWLDLLDSSTKLAEKLSKIVVPLICTYSCDLFDNHSDEKDESFLLEYEQEVEKLKKHFDDNYNHPWKQNLQVIVILFPVQSKNLLVKKLHEKLIFMQKLGD